MTEILHNAWMITRAILFVLHIATVCMLSVCSLACLNEAQGRMKILAIPIATIALFVAAAVPLTARWALL